MVDVEASVARRWRFSESATFTPASLALIAVFFGAGAPIPIMADLRVSGVAPSGFALASAAYFVAAAVGLLVLGRLSAFIGRKPVGLMALAAAAVGCVLMAHAEGAIGLGAARAMQGLSCGVAPGALAALVVDTSGRRRWQSALITGSAPMMGLPLGAVAVGSAAQVGASTAQIFWAVAIGQMLCGVLVAFSYETVVKSAGALRSLVPSLRVPRRVLGAVVIVCAVYVATWPLGGFYQAFGSIVAQDVLGSDSALAAGLIFASIMVLNPVGGLLSARAPAVMGVAVAMLAYGFLLVVVICAFEIGSTEMFVVAGLLGGIAQGVALTCAMRILLPATRLGDRSDILAAIFFVAYSSVAVSGFVVAPLAEHVALPSIALVYGGVGIAASVVACACAKRFGTRPRVDEDAVIGASSRNTQKKSAVRD